MREQIGRLKTLIEKESKRLGFEHQPLEWTDEKGRPGLSVHFPGLSFPDLAPIMKKLVDHRDMRGFAYKFEDTKAGDFDVHILVRDKPTTIDEIIRGYRERHK